MSILGSEQLIERIRGGEIVRCEKVDDVLGNVEHTSYSCTPGKVVLCGEETDEVPVLDWTGSVDGQMTHQVKPGEMIWVRTRHEVIVPQDLCAFWWQTHSLSRKGLMLINASMVEPGYHGHLACLFVNFGRQDVTIDVDTVVAKLVFAEIAGDAVPFGDAVPEDKYDRGVLRDARRAPERFLALTEFVSDTVDRAKTEIEKAGTKVADENSRLLHEEARSSRSELAKAADEQIERVSTDLLSAFKKSFPWAAALFALITLGVLFVGWLDGQLEDDIDARLQNRIDELVEERFDDVVGDADASTTTTVRSNPATSTTR